MKFNKSVLGEINNNKQLNDLNSNIWIIKHETVAIKNNYYLRVFHYQTNDVISELKQITYFIEFDGVVHELETGKFKLSETYNDTNVFGSVLNFTNLVKKYGYDKEFKLYIKEAIIDDELILFNNFQEIHPGTVNPKISKAKRSYLKQNNLYIADPFITADWWQCYCGGINLPSTKLCTNCYAEKEEIDKVLEMSNEEFQQLIINNILHEKNLSSINYNYDESYSSNFEALFGELIVDYEIDSVDLLEKPMREAFFKGLEEKISKFKEYPINWNDILSFEENIQLYISRTDLHSDFSNDIFSETEIKDLENAFNDFKKQKYHKDINYKKKRNIAAIVIIIALSSIIFYSFYIYPGQRSAKLYKSAEQSLANKDFDTAITKFAELNDYKDAEKLLKESKYQKLVHMLDEAEETRIPFNNEQLDEVRQVILHEIPNYKDSDSKLMDRIDYQQGLYLLKEKNYEEASTIFKRLAKLDIMDSSKKREETLKLWYEQRLSEINIEEQSGIRGYQQIIEELKSSGDDKLFDADKLIVQAKRTIVKQSLNKSKYINSFPSKEEYKVALKYAKEFPNEYKSKIGEIEEAIKFSGYYKKGNLYGNDIYIDVIKGYLFYNLSGSTKDTYYKYILVKTGNSSYDLKDDYTGSIKGALSLRSDGLYMIEHEWTYKLEPRTNYY